MSMCRVFSCVVGRGCLLWPVCSLRKTLLSFALLHSIFQGQICLFGWIPGVGDEQGGLASCDSWGLKETDTTEQLNLTELKEMQRYSIFLDWKNQNCENDYTTKCNLQIQCDPYQITNGIFHRTRTKSFTIHMETQKTLNSQSSLEIEEWSWRSQPFWLQIILQSYSHQDSMVLAHTKTEI